MAEDSDTLYVRGLNKNTDEIDDIWDDTVLNNAYDKALKMANEEVAKRIAMETNSNQKENKPKTEKVAATKSKSKKGASKKTEWKGGMPCRAIYDEDGLEYEAFLVKIIDDQDCIVRFLGYDNSEKVPLSSLKPTHGDDARMRQLEAALGERDDDGFESQAASESVDLYSDATSPGVAEKSSSKKKKSSHKKKHHSSSNVGDLPPLPMPPMNMFRNMRASDMPLPPPPPLASLSDRSDAEEQAISDMLLSWYMTGYYTGLYQGMKRQRQSRRYH